MAYISSFAYCDNIQTEITPQGPETRIVTPLNKLAPIALPGNFSFAVSCAIAGFDPQEKNTIRVRFVSEDGKIINDTNEITFQLPMDGINENHPAIMQFNLDFRNLVLPNAGLYSTTVEMNGEQIGEYKIPVVLGEM